MDNYISKNQLIKEIDLIPEKKHQELYELIHKFRISLNPSKHKINEIMEFAGSWSDISEEDFRDFSEDIEQRRQNSSSRRFSDENLFT